MNILKKVVHCVAINIPGKTLQLNLLYIEFLYVFNHPRSFLINKFDRHFFPAFLATRYSRFDRHSN